MTDPLSEKRTKPRHWKDAPVGAPTENVAGVDPRQNSPFMRRPKKVKSTIFKEEKEQAFSFILPPGWEAKGELKTAKPNGRYIVFNATGPEEALVFSGHPDLPQRYLVPGSWHGVLQPGRRTKFGEGPTEQYLFPSTLASAPQMCVHLATSRFGQIVPSAPVFSPEDVETTRQGAAQAGVQLPYIDACEMEFAKPDRSWVGMIKLVVFGGGNPGDIWQVEYISGYWCPVIAKETTALAYKVMLGSLKVGQLWSEEHLDVVSQEFNDVIDEKNRKIVKDEGEHAHRMNSIISNTREALAKYLVSRASWNR